MATDEPRTRELEMVWCHPWGRSKNGERAVIDGKGKGRGGLAEEAGPPHRDEWCDGVRRHDDFLVDSELRSL